MKMTIHSPILPWHVAEMYDIIGNMWVFGIKWYKNTLRNLCVHSIQTQSSIYLESIEILWGLGKWIEKNPLRLRYPLRIEWIHYKIHRLYCLMRYLYEILKEGILSSCLTYYLPRLPTFNSSLFVVPYVVNTLASSIAWRSWLKGPYDMSTDSYDQYVPLRASCRLMIISVSWTLSWNCTRLEIVLDILCTWVNVFPL